MKRILLLFLSLCLALPEAGAQAPYQIYPVPHFQEAQPGTAGFGSKVNLVMDKGVDNVTLNRACQIMTEHGVEVSVSYRVATGMPNLMLGINGSLDPADRQATRQGVNRSVFSRTGYDRHVVSLTADRKGRAQLIVLGENTDAVFCGLATVEQMLDRGTAGLPCVFFADYADTRSRGIIEGYYGVPYNAEVTKDLFRFMARYKMNTYMYGAKSDPYHTRYWGDPYPTEITPEQQRIGYLTQDMLRDIVDVAHASKVNFIWAIHPGAAFTQQGSADVIGRIMKKFESMYSLGVRQFGVFVDDVGVPSDEPTLRLGADRLTRLQQSVDRQWNRPGTALADRVKPIQYVPQLYAFSWVKTEAARQFFASLADTPEKIDIYITGRNVWSVPNSGDLAVVREWMGREPAWWWNYPCNDNDVTKLFPMDMYTNFRDEKHIQNDARMEPTLTGTHTLIANPMQQGEASKIALFSVADYAWNHEAFDHEQSWLASLEAVVGRQYAGALRRVAPCLRYFDEEALSELVADYKRSVEAGTPRPDALRQELSEVLRTCRLLDELAKSPVESHRLFLEDIRPWLTKLETMLQMALDLLAGNSVSDAPDLDNDEAFKFPILTGLGEEIALDVKTAEPAAQVLRPFIDWLRNGGKDQAPAPSADVR